MLSESLVHDNITDDEIIETGVTGIYVVMCIAR